MTAFVKELQTLINKHSVENASDTPDFILAEYMDGCLRAYDTAVQQRDKWHHHDEALPSVCETGVLTGS